jgi:hypothetical protein
MTYRAKQSLGTIALLLLTAVLAWGVVVQAMDGSWFLAAGRGLVAAAVLGLVVMQAPLSWQGSSPREKGVFFSLLLCGVAVSAGSTLG